MLLVLRSRVFKRMEDDGWMEECRDAGLGLLRREIKVTRVLRKEEGEVHQQNAWRVAGLAGSLSVMPVRERKCFRVVVVVVVGSHTWQVAGRR